MQPVAQQPSSGGGALLGAIVGGVLGNTVGHGMGRAAATGVGVVAGAAVGDSIETRGQPQAMQQCSTQTYYENRTAGYNVLYEYAGKQYNVQMPYDPGQTIRLQLSPIGAGGPAPATANNAPAGVIIAPPLGQTSSFQGETPIAVPAATYQGQPAYPVEYAYPAYPTYSSYPAYPAYYGYRPYYYPPVALSFSLGYVGGGGGYRHHHWR